MTDDLMLYREAVQEKICTKCIDGSGTGTCRLGNHEDCGLTLHFSKVVAAILSVKSDNLESYVQALQHDVCSFCKHQSPEGVCSLRNNLDCGLHRYFPLVVEAIEEVSSTVPGVIEVVGD